VSADRTFYQEPFPPGARLGDSLDILRAWRKVQMLNAELELAKADLVRAEHDLAYERCQGARKADAILPPSTR
jgi:hypothetical protein